LADSELPFIATPLEGVVAVCERMIALISTSTRGTE
jgi:hypothetical protein